MHAGISLVECIIYCVLWAVLSVLVFSFFSMHSQKFLNVTHQGQAYMLLYSTSSLLERTISMANPALAYWDTTQGLIFRTSKGDIGWNIKDQKLYQTVGTYDFIRHHWTKKSATLIAMHVTKFNYQPIIHHDYIKSVSASIALAAPIASYEKNILLNNRLL